MNRFHLQRWAVLVAVGTAWIVLNPKSCPAQSTKKGSGTKKIIDVPGDLRGSGARDLHSIPAISRESAELNSMIQSLGQEEKPGGIGRDSKTQSTLGPIVNSPAGTDDVWQLILDEYKSEQEVYLLELRIRNLLKNEKQRQNQRAPLNANPPAVEPDPKPIDSQGSSAKEPLQAASENAPSKNASPVEPVVSVASAQRVLTEPPDRLALADSLFVSGDAKLALKIYEGLSDNDPDGWISYQIANCLRILGRWDQAKPRLRSLVETQKDQHWHKNSEWWLEVVDRRDKLLQELKLQEEFIKATENENEIDN